VISALQTPHLQVRIFAGRLTLSHYFDIEPSAPAAEFHTYNDSASSTVETLRPDCWAARYNAARIPFWFSPNDPIRRALPFGKRSNSASIAATASLCFPLRVREPIAVGRVQPKGKYNDPLNAIQNVLYRTLWLSRFIFGLVASSTQ
jgi:hypothetical protein